MGNDKKKCPICAEEIMAEAKVCRFCGTKFDLFFKGYCPNCHQVVESPENPKCLSCGSELVDARLESRVSEQKLETAPGIPPVVPIAQSVAPPGVPQSPGPVPGKQVTAVGGSLMQAIAYHSIQVGLILMIVGFFNWGSASVALGEKKYYAPPAMALIIIAIWILIMVIQFNWRHVWSKLRLFGPFKGTGRAEKKDFITNYRKSLKNCNFSCMFKRSGKVMAYPIIILNLCALALWIYNRSNMSKEASIVFGYGIYVALAGILISLVASLALIPFKKMKTLSIDSFGTVQILEKAAS